MELLLSWPVWAQLILFLVVVTVLTKLTETFMRSFSRDFMNALAVLVRGWPPKAIMMDDDEDEEDDDK
jgi:membrane protein implicated in regulation of membrane protease activity